MVYGLWFIVYSLWFDWNAGFQPAAGFMVQIVQGVAKGFKGSDE
jgi:hypothetical protein